MNAYAELIAGMAKINVQVLTHPRRIERRTTGSLVADLEIGGGFPVGHITEIFGPSNSGKTTLALTAAQAVVAQGWPVFYFDQEHRVDIEWAIKLGLPFRMLEDGSGECTAHDGNGDPMVTILRADSAEQAMEGLKMLLRSKRFGYGALDSIAKLTPKATLEQSLDKIGGIGLQARLMKLFTDQITGSLAASPTALVAMNRWYENIGDMYEPKVSYGGGAVKFGTSLRLQTTSMKPHWVDDAAKDKVAELEFRFRMKKSSIVEIFGNEVSVFLVKDQITGDFAVNAAREVYELATTAQFFTNTKGEVYEGKGNCFWTDTEGVAVKLGGSKAECITYIQKNPELYVLLERLIRNL